MQYLRCKCGNREAWTSGESPKPCQTCDKCRSTLAYSPDSHQVPKPHKLELRYDTHTGQPSHKVCTVCYERFDVEVGECGDADFYCGDPECDACVSPATPKEPTHDH